MQILHRVAIGLALATGEYTAMADQAGTGPVPHV